jgi:hypothetical protein
MKFISLIAIHAFCIFLAVPAQESAKHKIKSYDTWVTFKNDPKVLRGVLYEIKDSSVLIVNPLFMYDSLRGNLNSDIASIQYNDIDLIKTRKLRSIKKGALIGSVTGFGFGVTYVSIAVKGMGILTATAALIGGITFAAYGTGLGALAGMARDRIPIKSSYENFSLYKSCLEEYSYIQEYPVKTSLFEHKGFIGITTGPSFPAKDFNTGSVNSAEPYFAGTGYSINMYVGYRFNKRFGVFISNLSNDFPVGRRDTASTNWGIVGFMAGPVFSFTLTDKVLIDLRPGIGYASAYLYDGDEEKSAGNGLGINLNASLQYNYSKRWGLLAELGYFTSKQSMGSGSKAKFPSLNPSLGLVYKFGKVSL